MSRRLLVTGLAVISPIGNDVDTFFDNIKKGTVGIKKISTFDTTDFKAKVAGEVTDFDPTNYMDAKTAKRMERFCQFAVAAAKMALEDAKIDMEKEDVFKVGVSVGSGIGSLHAIEREYGKMLEKGPSRVNPLFVPMMIANMAAGNVSIQTGARGKSINVVTACATGTLSIGEAYRSVQYGECDVMIAGGTEAAISPLGIAGFGALNALSTDEDPMLACKPFDKNRNGFIMGEGAGVVILEEYEHAKARGAKIYAEVAGYGATSDAYHITSPAEDGMGAAMAMKYAIDDAGIKETAIDYVNAHGTSTHHNDLFETRAIKKVFGEHAYNLKVNSTKSMIGHLLGAAGAVEFLTCVKSITEGYVHQTVGLKEPEEELDLNYCKDAGINMDVNYAMSNSLGFGGHNATVIVKKFVD